MLARYTVREIFSSKRAEIQQTIEAELKPRLASDGILLRSVQMGKVDCRMTIGAAWKSCWLKSWSQRRCASRWS